MNYFIGYLIEGDAAEWHRSLAKEISEKFGTWKLHEKIPSHVTILRPFSTEETSTIRTLLKNWTSSTPIPGNFTLSGYGRFDDTVVFARVEADPAVKEKVEILRSKIKEIPDMPAEDFHDWNPHATLANVVTSEEIEKIWEYVSALQKPNFVLPFDNLTLFRYEEEQGWAVDEIFRLS